MGLETKCKKIEGVDMYQLRSTITDELYHTEHWVTLEAAKKILIVEKLFELAEKVMEIDMDFPNHYRVNGEAPKINFDKTLPSFRKYAVDNYYGEGGNIKLFTDFQDNLKKFKIEIAEPPTIQYGLYHASVITDLYGTDNYGIPELEAISDSEEKLEQFCMANFNRGVGRPSVMNDHFFIAPLNIKVV